MFLNRTFFLMNPNCLRSIAHCQRITVQSFCKLINSSTSIFFSPIMSYANEILVRGKKTYLCPKNLRPPLTPPWYILTHWCGVLVQFMSLHFASGTKHLILTTTVYKFYSPINSITQVFLPLILSFQPITNFHLSCLSSSPCFHFPQAHQRGWPTVQCLMSPPTRQRSAALLVSTEVCPNTSFTR